jgi:hypothetical protein
MPALSFHTFCIYFFSDLIRILPEEENKMAATAIHSLTLDPRGKCSNAFFSETTNIIKAKLYMNVHWMVLYKHHVSGPFGFNCPSGFGEEAF